MSYYNKNNWRQKKAEADKVKSVKSKQDLLKHNYNESLRKHGMEFLILSLSNRADGMPDIDMDREIEAEYMIDGNNKPFIYFECHLHGEDSERNYNFKIEDYNDFLMDKDYIYEIFNTLS